MSRARALCVAVALTLLLFGLGITGVAASRARLEAPPPTRLLLDRDGAFLGELGPEDAPLGWWPVEELPWRVAAATVALEDRRFRHHPGVDPRAVGRALSQNLREGRRVSGASTLAMQVARLQRPAERTYLNKAVEALVALMITQRYGRDEVLAHYLRVVPYGNRIRGIRYAARRYLAKPVEDLSWAETAFLCAIPQSPTRYNPFDDRGRARAVARADRILDELFAQGLMEPAELELARRELGGLRVPRRGRRPEATLHAVLRMGELPSEALGADPLTVTSLDLELQEALQYRLGRLVRAWEADGAGQAAMIVLDRSTGEVLASVGSIDWFDVDRAGAIDYTRLRRYPGSTLKPFLYALALDQGQLSPATLMDDLSRGPEGIRNADERFLGPLLPRQALANSRNVPAVKLLQRLGVGQGYSLFRQLGLHRDERPASHYGLGLAIGGMPVTLEELARATTALADDGRLHELSWRRGGGGAVDQVLSPEAARTVGLWLSDPAARLPSFPRMGFSEYPFPVAVKTGTSGEFRDAWAVAWSDRYVVATWVGHPDWRPMRGLGGYRAGARLVQVAMGLLHEERFDGLGDGSLPHPEGAEDVALCALTGALAGARCPRVVEEPIAPTRAPTHRCGAHLSLEVDLRNGLLAHAGTPQRFRRAAVFVDPAPRYAEWARRVGLPSPPRALSPLDGEGGGALELRSAEPRPLDRPVTSPGQDPSARLTLISPHDGARLIRDPEIPTEHATLALRVAVDPPVDQVVWYVDDEPFAVVEAPYTARWPLQPGAHRFEARLPWIDARSDAVAVEVR